METQPVRCLILTCGNTLRGDDGVGPHLASWAGQQLGNVAGLRVVSRQQWTPELAEDLARAETAIFIDCSLALPAGTTILQQVAAAREATGAQTHQLDAGELLALAKSLYGSLPRETLLLTMGAGSVEIGEQFSAAVEAALPGAQALLEDTVERLAGKCRG
jgi:hydrogenase maturation protease